MKLCLISDIHGKLPSSLPEHDLLIIAGDLCPLCSHHITFQDLWLRSNFKDWTYEVTKKCVACWGNHDFVGEKLKDQRMYWHQKYATLKCVDGVQKEHLHTIISTDELIEIDGIKIWVSAHQLPFHDWAFNLSEEELSKKYTKIPEGTDIIVSHGPPYGFGDISSIPNKNGDIHGGSKSLLQTIDRVKPKLVVFGHFHQGYGIYDYNGVKLINASYLNEKYKPVNKPIILEI